MISFPSQGKGGPLKFLSISRVIRGSVGFPSNFRGSSGFPFNFTVCVGVRVWGAVWSPVNFERTSEWNPLDFHSISGGDPLEFFSISKFGKPFGFHSISRLDPLERLSISKGFDIKGMGSV